MTSMQSDLKTAKKSADKLTKEFKSFITRGSVIDMAVGVIVGGAFGRIVSSLVSDILMPAIGSLTGGFDIANFSATFGEATIAYGQFLQNIIDFFIIAISIFLFVKLFKSLSKKSTPAPVKDTSVDKKADTTNALLTEIRDELKKRPR